MNKLNPLFNTTLTLLILITLSGNATAIDGTIATSLDYGFFDKWYKTAGESVPMLSTTQTVAKKQYYTLYTHIGNYATNADSMATIKMDLKVTSPSGKEYFSGKDLNALDRKIHNSSFVQLSSTNLRACFEEDDEPGIYTMTVTLHDINTNSSQELSTSITLTDFKRVEFLMADRDEVQHWLQKYYKDPNPLLAMEAFLFISNQELTQSAYYPFFSFFIEVFENNTFLIPELLKIYETQPFEVRMNFLNLLHYIGYDDPGFYSSLLPNEHEYAEYLKTYPNHFTDTEITSPSHLDILWGKFFSSGNYEPILRLVKSLEYSEFLPYLEDTDRSDKSEETAQRIGKAIIYKAAKWSLDSNYGQHRLVEDYCRYILVNEELSESVKKDLLEIVNK